MKSQTRRLEKAATIKYDQEEDFSPFTRTVGRVPFRQDCPSKAAVVKMQIYRTEKA